MRDFRYLFNEDSTWIGSHDAGADVSLDNLPDDFIQPETQVVNNQQKKPGNKIGGSVIVPPKPGLKPNPTTKPNIPVDPKVKALQQQILAKDPNALPKYGADGRMGPETRGAMQRLGMTGASGQAPVAGSQLPNGSLSSGDAALDARMADNAAYFKMTPEQRKAADAEAAKKLNQADPSMTQQITNYLGKGPSNMNQQNESKKFTNTVDELKYYSQILAETQLDEFKTYDSMRNPPTYADAVKARELGRINPEYGLNAKFASSQKKPPHLDLTNPVPNTPIPGGPTDDANKPVEFPQSAAKTFNPAQTSVADDEQAQIDQATAELNMPPVEDDMTSAAPATNFPSNNPASKSAPSAAAPTPKPTPNPKVKEAQQALIQFGYLPKGSDTGIMTKATRDAQKELQAAYNSSPQPVNPMQEHISFGEIDSLARIVQLSRR